MEVIRARNVNDAYRQGRALLERIGERSSSRAGDVLVAPYPVTTVYERPCERVLLDTRRDANPFFHLAEATWMLAGQQDARWLDTYVRDFSARFAEPGTGLQWGAYGKRWRGWFADSDNTTNNIIVDQLPIIVNLLRKDPSDRRIVLQMWDCDADLGYPKKDVPCNLVLVPRVREHVTQVPISYNAGEYNYSEERQTVLDITVFCRSNDIVFGCYGANAVHFSVLQEYLAAAIGVGVGRYYQVSNNWHGYVDVLAKTAPETVNFWFNPYEERTLVPSREYFISPRPMVTDAEHFLADCEKFVQQRDRLREGHLVAFHNDWFVDVLVQMELAHSAWRRGNMHEALHYAERVAATDWRAAVRQWLQSRRK